MTTPKNETSIYRLPLRQDQRARVRVLAALQSKTMAEILSSLIDQALNEAAKDAPLLTKSGASK